MPIVAKTPIPGRSGGAVGVSDLLAVLAEWGCVSDCTADTDSDGAVGVGDLLAVLAAWGDC